MARPDLERVQGFERFLPRNVTNIPERKGLRFTYSDFFSQSFVVCHVPVKITVLQINFCRVFFYYYRYYRRKNRSAQKEFKLSFFTETNNK